MVVLPDLARIDPPVARHAEVEDQGVAAIGVDQPVFGAAPKSAHPRAGQSLAEIEWQGAPQVEPPRLDVGDALAVKNAREAADGRLDFGKLGHARDMAEPRSSPLEAQPHGR